MNRIQPKENTPRVIAAAAVFFGGLVVLGIVDGVFARLGTELVLALAGFALGFALLTYGLDAGVRGTVNRLFARRGARRKGADRRAAAA